MSVIVLRLAAGRPACSPVSGWRCSAARLIIVIVVLQPLPDANVICAVLHDHLTRCVNQPRLQEYDWVGSHGFTVDSWNSMVTRAVGHWKEFQKVPRSLGCTK